MKSKLFNKGGWKPLFLSLVIQCSFFLMLVIGYYIYLSVAYDNLQPAGNKFIAMTEGFILIMDTLAIFSYTAIFMAIPVFIFTYYGFNTSFKDSLEGRDFSVEKYFRYGFIHFQKGATYYFCYFVLVLAGMVYFFG